MDFAATEGLVQYQAFRILPRRKSVDQMGYDQEDYQAELRVSAWRALQKVPAEVDRRKWTAVAVRRRALNLKRQRHGIGELPEYFVHCERVDDAFERRAAARQMVALLRNHLSADAWECLVALAECGSYRAAVARCPELGSWTAYRDRVRRIRKQCLALLERHEKIHIKTFSGGLNQVQMRETNSRNGGEHV